MRAIKVVVLAALLSSWAAAAQADNVIMEFIESWSGPGPYAWTKGVEVQIVCLPTREAAGDSFTSQLWSCHKDDPARVRGQFTFGASWGDTGGAQPFMDDPLDRRSVKQLTIEAMYLHRLNSIVDVGGGVQWVRLTNDAQLATVTSVAYSASTQWRTGPALRVSFTPLGALHFSGRAGGLSRLIHLEYESAYFGGSWTAADYGNPVSRYSAKKEFQSRVGIAIDLAPLLVAIHPR
jgi:hypothetical protein